MSSSLTEELAERLRSPDMQLDEEVAREVRDHAASLVLTNPADAYKLSGDLLQALNRSRNPAGEAAEAVVWRCRAEASAYTGRLKESRDAYVKASEAARAAGAGAGKLLGQILVGRIGVLSLMGASRDASAIVPEAERILKRHGDLEYLGKLYMNVGNAFYHAESYEKARRAYGRAAEIFDAMGIRDAAWVGLLINQAVAATQLGRIEEARRLFLETEEDCRRRGHGHLQARVQFNRAFVEQGAGDFREALALLERAGEMFEAHGEIAMAAATERARAEIYLELGMPREAKELARSSAAAFGGEEMAVDEMISRIVEARALLLLDRPEASASVLEPAAAFYARQRIRPKLAVVHLLLGWARLVQGRLVECRSLARRALRSFQAFEMTRLASEAGRLLAESYLASGRPDRAQEILRPALWKGARLPLGEQIELNSLGGRISAARGRVGEAAQRFRRAVKSIEAQRRVIPGIEFRARAFERHVAVYHDLIDLILSRERPRIGTLFPLVEAARARGFRERLGPKVRSPDQRIARERARLGSLTRRLEEVEYAGGTGSGRSRELRREVRGLEREIETRVLRAQGREPGAAGWRGTHDVREIGARLAADESLVEYFVGGPRVLAFVFTRGRGSFITLPEPADSIREAAERIRFHLETLALTAERLAASLSFLRDAADSVLSRLYEMLIRPLEDRLHSRGRLIVVPHGFLHDVPFECLKDGERYVDERWCVSRLPTTDVLFRRVRRERRAPRRVLVAGVVDGGPASVESEMLSVASSFPRDDVRLLRDPTADALLEELPRSHIIHLVTHAVFRGDNPAFSRLSLRGGALFLADVLDVRLNADLVVLSACNTGQVLTGRADDLSGVAHGFLAAGARRLVASQWRVHDAATQTVMEEFYRAYSGSAEGDPVRALHAAGRAARERWAHPFFWGGFSVHGR